MKRPLLAVAAVAAAGLPWLAGCGQFSPERAASVATGYVSHQLCSAVFVAGQAPDDFYRDAIAPVGGALAGMFDQVVDRDHGEVRASFAGMAQSRAIYRPPYGCINATGTSWQGQASTLASPAGSPGTPPRPAATRPVLPPIAGPDPVRTTDPALSAALDHAFAEAPQPPFRHTKAVVVVHGGRVIAERYADGVGVDTPLPGWSATKSMTSALLGILVRQGRLDMQAPAPIAAWSDPADPRHAITPDELLRMTSGLDAGQSLNDVGPFNPAARLLFVEHDMAAFAAASPLAHPPGTHWNYTDANTILLSRIVADAVQAAEPSADGQAATLAFVHRELFDKLGMAHAVLEFDAAGTPVGGSHLWASARDWSRLGLLFLHDGMAGGERILPPGWVDASARETPGSEDYGYAAGFWSNRGSGAGARLRIGAGMPADAFMARGSYGQYVVIVPSQDLVITRLGPAWTERSDMDAVARLTREVIAAVGKGPGGARIAAR